jgi:hypothetical protein
MGEKNDQTNACVPLVLVRGEMLEGVLWKHHQGRSGTGEGRVGKDDKEEAGTCGGFLLVTYRENV